MLPQKRNITGAVDMIADEYPDAFNSIEDVYIQATSGASEYWNPRGYENKLVCREALGMSLPPVPYSTQQQIDASRAAFQQTLAQRSRNNERQRRKRERDAQKEGRKRRAYRRR